MAKEPTKVGSTGSKSIGNLVTGKLYRNLKLPSAFFSASSGSLTEKTGMILFSKTLEDSIEMINSSLVVQKILFKSAYVDKIPLNSFIHSKSPLNLVDVYRQIKDSTTVTNCVQSLYTLKSKNVFILNFNYLEKLDNLQILENRNNRINFIKELLVNNINKLNNNNYKIINLLINLKDFYQENFSLTNYDNLGIIFLNAINLMMKDAKYSSLLSNVNLIVKDPKFGMGYILPLDPKTFNESEFVSLIKKTSSAYQRASKGNFDGVMDELPASNSLTVTKAAEFKSFLFVSNKGTEKIDSSTPIFTNVTDAVNHYMKVKLNDCDVSMVIAGGPVYTVKASTNGSVEEQLRASNAVVYKFDLPVVVGTETVDPAFLQEYFDIALPIVKIKKPIDIKDRSSEIFDLKSSEDAEYTVPSGTVKVDFQYYDNVSISSDFAAKEAVSKLLKELKINVNSVELNSVEKELVDEIQLRVIGELTSNPEYAGFSVKELAAKASELVMTSPDIVPTVSKLADERVMHIDSIKSASLIQTLKNKQDDAKVTIDGKQFSLADKIKETSSRALVSKDFQFTTLNKAIKTSTTSQFRSSYNDNLYEKDMFNIFTSFHQSEDIPIFVHGIDIRDDSDAYNRVNMLEVKFLMPNGKPQTTRVQVPKVSSDGYLFLNGSKKLISNQMVSLPIVKVWSSGEDVVRFVTNYNKIFVSRVNGALNPRTDAFRKAMLAIQKDGKLHSRSYNIRFGSSTESNHGYINSLEYDEIAGYMFMLKVDDVNLIFSRRAVLEEFTKKGIDYELLKENIDPEKYFPIGYSNTSVFWSDEYGTIYRSTFTARKSAKSEEVLVLESENLYEMTKSMFAGNSELGKYLDNMVAAKLDKKKYAYSAVKVVGVRMPLIGFLGYKEGVTNIFDRYSVGYEFVQSGKEPSNQQLNTGIKFADGYLFFDDRNIVASLLVNGLRALNPEGFNFEDYNAKGEAYDNFFTNVGKPRMGKALSNFYTLFIDPITSEILEDHKIPSDIIGSFLYCNTLLQYPGYQKKNDMSTYRARNSELINALLYKIVASNIEAYRRAGRGESSTAGLTLPSNALIKELLESPIVEEVPILNPIREAETLANSTYKGFGGSPMGHAKGTEEVRAYDPSMRGIYGVTTPDNANTGVTRKLSMNSNIRNLRGYLKIDPKGEFNATNMLTVGELLSPFTFTHADPPRKHTCGFQ